MFWSSFLLFTIAFAFVFLQVVNPFTKYPFLNRRWHLLFSFCWSNWVFWSYSVFSLLLFNFLSFLPRPFHPHPLSLFCLPTEESEKEKSSLFPWLESTYALTISPVAMSLEELIPSTHLKSHMYAILIRTALVISTLIVGLTIPFFGKCPPFSLSWPYSFHYKKMEGNKR